MSGFRLLAIRPLEGCDEKFRKNLKEGMLYKFYQDFRFYVKDGEKNVEITNSNYKHYKSFPVSKIDSSNNQMDLYSEEKLKINISAIVGMNGSGKSSLIEIIHICSFLLAEKLNLLEEIKKLNSQNNPEQIVSKKLFTTAQELSNIKDKAFYEIFYEIDGIVYKLINNVSDGLIMRKYRSLTAKWNYVNGKKLLNKKSLKSFFYTISLNYSLYGSNESYAPWVGHLFHKNDGYKTPVVINPYRTRGIVDINTENHLAQVRSILNLSSSNKEEPVLVNEKKISFVRMTLDLFENNTLINSNYIQFLFNDIFKIQESEYKIKFIDFFNKISIELCGLEIYDKKERESIEIERAKDNLIKAKDQYNYSENTELTNSKLRYELIKYSIRKVFKICAQHKDDFEEFISQETSEDPLIIKDLDGLINRFKKDKSHITLKLRQSIYTYHMRCFESDKWEVIPYQKNSDKFSYSVDISWVDFREKILKAEKDFQKYLDERMEVIPSAFVKPTIFVKKSKTDNDSSYVELSSGEQQLSNTIQTIIYHVYNLNSVHYNIGVNDKINYKYVNIILDEVELYYHPEFQRIFLVELLKSLKRVKTDKLVGINILFSTHSPFILSDIPAQNILRLENGEPSTKEFDQTFGANIHDLLANDFFLKNGFMGEFAQEKVKGLIEYLTSNHKKSKGWDINSAKDFIELVGEPFLKNDLLELYKKKKEGLMTKEDIEKEIDRLTKLKNG